jgi:hypothetical protein
MGGEMKGKTSEDLRMIEMKQLWFAINGLIVNYFSFTASKAPSLSAPTCKGIK